MITHRLQGGPTAALAVALSVLLLAPHVLWASHIYSTRAEEALEQLIASDGTIDITGDIGDLGLTNNTIPKATSSGLADSSVTDDGSTVTVSGAQLVVIGVAQGFLLKSQDAGDTTTFETLNNGAFRVTPNGTASIMQLSHENDHPVLGLSHGGGANRDGIYAGGSGTGNMIFRSANHIIHQRNGTNAQTFNLYGTFTDASNYERGAFTFDEVNDQLEITAETAGTGADNLDIEITPAGTGVINLNGPTSAEGSAGQDATCASGVASLTVTNGLVTAITCS